MNIDLIKEKIKSNLNRKVEVTVYGLRNRTNVYRGILYQTFGNIFTIMTNNEQKSFTYNDVITGEVKIKYI